MSEGRHTVYASAINAILQVAERFGVRREDLLSQGLSILEPDLPRWKVTTPHAHRVNTYALSQNAVILVDAHRGGCTLIALNRGTGKKLWELKLPGRPLHSGMAIAADGSIVLALTNGSLLCVNKTAGEVAQADQ